MNIQSTDLRAHHFSSSDDIEDASVVIFDEIFLETEEDHADSLEGIQWNSQRQAESNIKYIHSTPTREYAAELLEVLKECAELMNHDGFGGTFEKDEAPLLDKAFAIIAKAEGRNPYDDGDFGKSGTAEPKA